MPGAPRNFGSGRYLRRAGKSGEVIRMAVSSKLSAFVAIFLAGAVIGAAGTYGSLEWRKSAKLREFEKRKAAEFEMPEGWLFPPGTTFENLFPDEELRDALISPDSVHIHREGGALKVGDWSFESEGVAPDVETLERLRYALGSFSSWEPGGKMCVFHADVLLRLEKDGKAHDIIFCFGCGETTAGVDMSDPGKRTFFKCFCDTLPDFAALHEKRAIFEARK